MFIRKFAIGIVATAIVTTFGVFSLPTTGWAQLDEMVVTARKREEILQDVPVMIRAFSAQDISRKNIDSMESLALLSPSIQFDQAGSPDQQRIVVRGLSPSRGRTNIAILVDGIDTSTESIRQTGQGSGLNSRLIDLERIEVVKGPQAALFGRSAFNGAINFITADPTDEFTVDVKVEVGDSDGSFGRYEGSAVVNIPITENLGFRMNFAGWDEEGFFKNSISGDRIGGADGFGFGGTMKWQATSNLSFKARVTYSEDSMQPRPIVTIAPNMGVASPGSICIVAPNDGSQGPTTIPGSVAPWTAHSVAEGTDPDTGTTNACGTWDGVDTLVFTGTPGAGEGGPTASQLAVDAAMNPLGTPLLPGPIVAGVNDCIVPYKKSMIHSLITCQFVGEIPDMDELGAPAIGVDPRTGNDFRGLERKMLRASLVAEWDLGAVTLTSVTGMLDMRTDSEQDWLNSGDQAKCGTFIIAPTAPYETCTLALNADIHDVEQYSQELRLNSNWDFPIAITTGGQFWWEDRDTFAMGGTIRARSFDCGIDLSASSWTEAGGLAATLIPDDATGSTFCGVASLPITGDIFQAVDDARKLAFGGLLEAQNAGRQTEHWSAYFLVETPFDELLGDNDFLPGNWTLNLEGRWNHEELKVMGQDSQGSGSTGVDLCGAGPIFSDMEGPTGDPLPVTPAASPDNACSGLVYAASAFGTSQRVGGPPIGTLADPVTVAAFRTPLCGPPFPTAPGAECFDDTSLYSRAELSADWFVPKVVLEHEPTYLMDAWGGLNEMNIYLSWGRPIKPGGFATSSFGSSGFDPRFDIFQPETLDVYEIGFKSTWWNNQLLVNGAGFFQDYTNKQVSTQRAVVDEVTGQSTTVPYIRNAGAAEVWGAELDVVLAPESFFTDDLPGIGGGQWMFQGALTYLRAMYTDNVVASALGSDIFVQRDCEPFYDFENIDVEDDPDRSVASGLGLNGDETFAPVATCINDGSGNFMEDAPKWAAIMSASYVAPISNTDLSWFLEMEGSYQSMRWLEQENAVYLGEWWNSNMRIGLQSDRFELLFFVNNVFDGQGIQGANTSPGLSNNFGFGRIMDPTVPADTGSPAFTFATNAGNFGGPEMNSAVPSATLRPPRHFGLRGSVSF